MSVKKYLRKNIYKWHRVTSLIVALPIVLWSLSGFLHPVMNSFKPDIRNQYLPVAAIDTSKIHVSLQEALQQNHIAQLHNFRIIKLDSNYFYQIQQSDSDTLTYLSCSDGNLLLNGDKIYATYLAQRYLSEPVSNNKSKMQHLQEMNADIIGLTSLFHKGTPYAKAKIISVDLIKTFNKEYKNSNVLLPVYRITFGRSDKIRLYIETSTDRLATAVDNKKAWFINFFALAHTWSFLDGFGQTKNVLLGIISFLCFLTSLLGYCVYNIVNKKKATTKNKSLHRNFGNIFILTTMLYGFSGAWHAFHKLSDTQEASTIVDRSQFLTNELNFSWNALLKNTKANEKLTNVSVVKMNGENYWQLFVANDKEKQKRYINTKTFQELTDGDLKYGSYVAGNFNHNHSGITQTRILTSFTNQYNMMYKRLPVVEVDFSDGNNYYIETSTGCLSAAMNASGDAERFSFANLHMHHYWEHWLGEPGKTIQKIVLISSTLGLFLLAITGMLTYYCRNYRK